MTSWLAANSNALLPLLADLSGIVLYLLLLPRLVAAFRQPAPVNALLIGAVYLLFCGAVYLLRRQPPPAASGRRGLLAFLGLTFTVFVSYMVADSGGFLANVENLDPDPGLAAMAVIMVGTLFWLALLFLYPLLLGVSIPTVATATASRQFLGLLGVNLMILVTAAYWQVTFSGVEPYDNLALGGKILIFLAVYAFFLLFFAAPRTLALLKNPAPTALVSFLLQTTYYVWSSLSGSAWS